MDETKTKTEARTYYRAAQVRACDLDRDDMIELEGRWRELHSVFRTPEEMLTEFYGRGPEREEAEGTIDRIGLDHRVPRPDRRPAVLPYSRTGKTKVLIDGATAEVMEWLAVAALLQTGEYVAVGFVREEACSADEASHGWAIIQRRALVTVQVPVA